MISTNSQSIPFYTVGTRKTIKSSQKQSKAVKSNQKQSKAVKSSQKQSSTNSCTSYQMDLPQPNAAVQHASSFQQHGRVMPPMQIEVVIGHFRQPHTVGFVAVVAGVVGVVVVVVQWHGSSAGDQGTAFQHSKHAVVGGLQGVLLRDRFAQQCRGTGTTGGVHVQHRVHFQPLFPVFFHGVGFQFEGGVAAGTTFGAGFVGQVARRAHPVRGFAFVSVPFHLCLVLFLQTRRLFIDHVGKGRVCGGEDNTTQKSMDRRSFKE
jgi:hypothetical protein